MMPHTQSLLQGIDTNNEIDKASSIQAKAAAVGFDWPCTNDVIDKLYEEIDELKQAITNKDSDNIEEEVGDLFYTLINLARHLHVDPEKSLQLSSEKFMRRFCCLEQMAGQEDIQLATSSLDQLETLWQRAKWKESE